MGVYTAVVTVLLYWFVFGHVMGQDKKEILAVGVEAPYVLWLTAGLVPWFYFSGRLTMVRPRFSSTVTL